MNEGKVLEHLNVCVQLKDRKRSLSGINNRSALWHVKIRRDAKVVLWLLKEMSTTSSDFMKIPQTAEEVTNQLMDIFCMFGAPSYCTATMAANMRTK